MVIDENETRYRRTIGDRVRTVRARHNLSQLQLAETAGLTRGFVSAVERGRHSLDAYRLGKLAAALGIPLTELLSSDGRQT